MIVELIPVLELVYQHTELTIPKYPYWENQEDWDLYLTECYEKAGFKDKFTLYSKGFPFSKISDISRENLTKLILDHTQDLRGGKYTREESCTFFGGFALVMNKINIYFPQCCGELIDIFYWEKLAKGEPAYYEGHPCPSVYFEKNSLILDFSVEEFDESFQPTPSEAKITIEYIKLQKAVENAKEQLYAFEKRLEEINQYEKLGIDNIGKLLIWGDY